MNQTYGNHMHTPGRAIIGVFRIGPLLTLAILVAACSKNATGTRVATMDQATETYGRGFTLNPAVTYQPNVVLVGGGPKSIRYASADGLVWVIDAKAAHARDLQPGKIMLLTSRAAGRIMKIEPRGDDLAVTLGPMELGDVFKEATINIDAKLDPTAMVFQAVPEVPYMYKNLKPASTARTGEGTQVATSKDDSAVPSIVRYLPVAVAAADTVPNHQLPAATRNTVKLTVNDYEVELSAKVDAKNTSGRRSARERLGLKVLRNYGSASVGSAKTGLKAGIDVSLFVRDLRFKSNTVYHDGKVDQGSTNIVLEGLEQLQMDVSTGIEKAVGDNKRFKVEVPVELTTECPVYEIPFMCQIKFKFILETALGGNNATLSTKAGVSLDGPLGYRDGEVVLPTVMPLNQPASDALGLSMGVSGVVFAVEGRFMLGIGVPSAFGGPYTKVTAALGVTHSAGASIGLNQDCYAANLKVDVGAGVGVEFTPTELGALKKLLGDTKFATEYWEKSRTVYLKDFYEPQKQVCVI